MEISEVKISDFSLVELDAYSSSTSACQLLQTGLWLKFQQSVSRVAHLYSFIEEEKKYFFVGFEYRLPLGKKYLYIPRGPVIDNEKIWSKLLSAIKDLCVEQKFMFVRFEPDVSWFPTFVGMTVRRVNDVQPHRTLLTDLSKIEKDLLEAMHPKTRYNIRLALKRGLAFNDNDSDVDGFLELMKETSARDRFSSHAADYYRKMIESGVARLATIRDDQQILAAGIFSEFGNVMTYLHGASSSSKRELMAPYALHWEMMMLAKSKDIKYYDWHGIDDKKWPGFTRFKKGFGGKEVTYPGTFDLILDRVSYTGYTVVRGLKKIF